MEFSFFFLTDATVSSDSLNPHKDLIFGTWDRDPANCTLKRGGGWWYGSSSDCAVSSIGKKLDRNNPKGSAPTSTEMKIRPVDFF